MKLLLQLEVIGRLFRLRHGTRAAIQTGRPMYRGAWIAPANASAFGRFVLGATRGALFPSPTTVRVIKSYRASTFITSSRSVISRHMSCLE
jgi:hypothetical protein